MINENRALYHVHLARQRRLRPIERKEKGLGIFISRKNIGRKRQDSPKGKKLIETRIAALGGNQEGKSERGKRTNDLRYEVEGRENGDGLSVRNQRGRNRPN